MTVSNSGIFKILFCCVLTSSLLSQFAFAQAPSPVKATPNRTAYFPQTEDLAPDEMPNYSTASNSTLIQLGDYIL
jgi:hypothetical protein